MTVDEVRAALTARYAEMERALIAGDVEAFMATTAADWRGLAPDGTTSTRAELAETLRQLFASGTTITRYTVEFEKVEAGKGIARVTFRERNTRTVRHADGESDTREVISRTRETWTLTDSGWLAALSEPLELLEVWIDGERQIYKE